MQVAQSYHYIWWTAAHNSRLRNSIFDSKHVQYAINSNGSWEFESKRRNLFNKSCTGANGTWLFGLFFVCISAELEVMCFFMWFLFVFVLKVFPCWKYLCRNGFNILTPISSACFIWLHNHVPLVETKVDWKVHESIVTGSVLSTFRD